MYLKLSHVMDLVYGLGLTWRWWRGLGGGTYLELSYIMDLVDRLGVGVGGRVGSVQRVYVCQQEQPVGFHSRCYLNPSAALRKLHFKLSKFGTVLRLC